MRSRREAITAWWATARANQTFRMAMVLAVGIIAVDQAVKLAMLHAVDLRTIGKIEISGIFDLTYVENRGVSFGLFAGGMVSRVILSIVAIVVSIFVIAWAGTLTRRVAAIGAGFIVGGAIGNVIDRVSYGYVVDFFDFSGLGFPWVFNVADAAINVGVACLLYDAFIDEPKRAKAAKLTKSQDGGPLPRA